MSIIEDIRARHDNAQDAARELGGGLMRGERDKLKLGYSHENAALVAIDAYGLSKLDAVELRCYLLGFAHGLYKVGDDYATNAYARSLGSHSEHFQAAFHNGHDAGWENAEGAYPAAIQAAQSPTAEDQ